MTPLATYAVETPAPPPAAAEHEAQETAANLVFFEGFGSGLVYSVNYARLVPAWSVAFRAGASFFTANVNDQSKQGNFTLASFPLLASYFIGNEHHKLELGLGATILYVAPSTDSTGATYYGKGSGLGVALSGVVGYRYFPRGRGVTFGAGFTPLLRAEKGFLPWGGVNVGYAF